MSNNLTKNEKIVLTVVQEYLDKNRQFNLKKILPFIISRFRLASININKQGIEEILKSLVQKNLLVEGSKLSYENILSNFKRIQIYNFILKNPGTYFNKIVKQLKLSNHVVVWHLNMLEKFNYIKKESLDNHDIYFDTDLELEVVKKIYFSSKKKSREIINHLKTYNEGITKTQISNDLNMHPNTVTKYLNVLLENDLVIKERISNKDLYFNK